MLKGEVMKDNYNEEWDMSGLDVAIKGLVTEMKETAVLEALKEAVELNHGWAGSHDAEVLHFALLEAICYFSLPSDFEAYLAESGYEHNVRRVKFKKNKCKKECE
jgi:hypothetical protein